MKNKNTDFINYGTYKAQDAEILKKELEKAGIPTKILYPGTSVGKEATAGAYFTGYQLMIRACDFQRAEELRNKFNIEPIGIEEKMPLPKTYAWAKRGLNRYSLIGWVISIIGVYISSYLAAEFKFFAEKAPLYFIIAFSIFFVLWFGSTVYNIFQEKKKH
jgi:hypothetical protein